MENQAIADGGKRKSATVTITEDGQVENVVLAYELVIFANGVVSESVEKFVGTGALNGYGAGIDCKISEDVLKITCTADTSTNGKIYAYKKVDLTDYKTLSFSVVNYGRRFGIAYFGVFTSTDIGGFAASHSIETTGAFNVDVSTLSGEYWVGFWGANDFSSRKASNISLNDIILK